MKNNKVRCINCNNENGVYLFAIINGQDVYDCPKCNKRTMISKELLN